MKPKFDVNAGVKTRTGLVEITISRTADTAKTLRKIYGKLDMHGSGMFTLTQGEREITIITDSMYEKLIIPAMEKERLIKRIDNLGSVSLALPEQAYETQGLLYLAMKMMYDEGINIVEIVSTLTELIIVVMEEDIGKAKYAMEKMIKL